MLRTWIAIECEHCNGQFPRHANGITMPRDGALETPAMLRAEAKKLGWQRHGGHDYCPACEKKHHARTACTLKYWPVGHPETVQHRDMHRSLLIQIALRNGNMTIKQVLDCLLEGEVVSDGKHEFQMDGAQ